MSDTKTRPRAVESMVPVGIQPSKNGSTAVPDGCHGSSPSLRAKICIAFAMMALVVTVSTLVTIRQVDRIAQANDVLRDQHVPAAGSGLSALSGINASHAELRRWILSGDVESKARRASIWEDQIQPAIQRLHALSANSPDPSDSLRLQTVCDLAQELRAHQDQIEHLAQGHDNNQILAILDEADALSKVITDSITMAIESEKVGDRTPARRQLLKQMADFRGSMALSNSDLRAYALSSETQYRESFAHNWQRNQAAYASLVASQALLSEKQRDAFSLLATSLAKYGLLAPQMFLIDGRDEANRRNELLANKAVPVADELRHLLHELVADQRHLMEQSRDTFRRQVRTLSGIQWVLFGIGLAASLILAVVLTHSAVGPIRQAVEWADAIAAGDLGIRSVISGSSEAESLGRSLGHMATSLATQIHRTEQSEHRLRLVVEASSTGMVMVDSAGTIVLVNSQMEEIFGYSREELVGQPVEVFLPAQLHQQHRQDRANFMQDPRVYEMGRGRDLYAYHKSGRSIPVEVGLTPVNTEAGMHVLATVVDITARKQYEDDLKRANEQLNRSNQELEQFAYVASHDLQEPLRKISSFCSVLAEDYSDKFDEDGRRQVGYIVDGAARMKTLIQDLLAFSRVETKAQAFTEVDANEALADALYNLEFAIAESGARISTAELPLVLADGSQLTQLLQNLIGNAIKYRSDDTPEIRIGVEDRGDVWEFSVSDNGIGIAPEFHERVFGIFKRLHNRAEYSGTGIGLAICKRIAERFGGRVWIESEAGRGSKFSFTTPKLTGVNQQGDSYEHRELLHTETN